MKQFTTEFIPEHGLPFPDWITALQLAAILAVPFEILSAAVLRELGAPLPSDEPVTREHARAALGPYGLIPVKPYLDRLRCGPDFESFCQWIGVESAAIWDRARLPDGGRISRTTPMTEGELGAVLAAINNPNFVLDIVVRESTSAVVEVANLREAILAVRETNLKAAEKLGGASLRTMLELQIAVQGVAMIPPIGVSAEIMSDDFGANPQLILCCTGDELVLTNEEQAAALRSSWAEDNHLDEVDGPGFEFPTTDVYEQRDAAIAALGSVDWRERGLLQMSGYRVGRTKGKGRSQRRRLLNFIFLKDDLRGVDDPAYAAEWGAPKSNTRLRKLAESIAAFARNAKRRSSHRMDAAVSDWEEDLEYLRATFYDRWSDFPWPHVSV